MSEAAPRRPARAWRLLWAHALLAALYVGGYVVMRASDRFRVSYVWHSTNGAVWHGTIGAEAARTCVIAEPGTLNGFVGRRARIRRTSLMSLYYPCIAVEEWWRNR